MNAEIDIRHVLPAIRVPTLVLHRTDDLPFVGNQDAMLDAIEAFLNRTARTRRARRPAHR